MQLHDIEKLHKCTLCDQSYFQPNVLRQHMIIHKRINVCTECEMSFRDSSSLKIHIQKHRNKPLSKGLKCERIFNNLGALSTHINKHTKVTCQICDREFSRAGLTYHMMAHRGEKPHVCKDCKKTFRRPFDLKKHMLVHSDERSFQCTEFQRSF